MRSFLLSSPRTTRLKTQHLSSGDRTVLTKEGGPFSLTGFQEDVVIRPAYGETIMATERIDDPNTNRGLQAALVAEQNDAFRKAQCGYPSGEPIPEGKLVVTRGVHDEGVAFQMVLVERVALYNDFTFDNDPTGWHEFGSVEVNGKTVWFKLDLYDLNYEMGSETPHDPDQTRRVMTLLFPHEY